MLAYAGDAPARDAFSEITCCNAATAARGKRNSVHRVRSRCVCGRDVQLQGAFVRSQLRCIRPVALSDPNFYTEKRVREWNVNE